MHGRFLPDGFNTCDLPYENWEHEFAKARRRKLWQKLESEKLEKLAPYPSRDLPDEKWQEMFERREWVELTLNGWSNFDALLIIEGKSSVVLDYERKYLKIKAKRMREYLRFVDPTDPRINQGDEVWKGPHWSFSEGGCHARQAAMGRAPERESRSQSAR